MKEFRWDANFDGVITVSDFGLILKWLILLPGNIFMYVMHSHFPKFAAFFEITQESQDGVMAMVISGVVWLIIYGMILGSIENSVGRY